MRQPLSALETTFLGLETPGVSFVYGCILELDRDLEVEALRRHAAATLAAAPRYRQRIVRRRLRRAMWDDDPDFQISRHVLDASVAAPGGTPQLEALVGELLATELPHEHAPWRLWSVHGLAGGRGAVVALVHHTLSDGLAGLRLLEHLLGRATPAPAPALRPRPRLRTLASWRNVRSLARMLRDGLSPASKIGLNPREVGRERLVATHAVPLEHVRDIERALGVTNNDVVLACVAGALRRYLTRHGYDCDAIHDVRAMVPVGLHAKRGDATAGNRIALLLAPLPIDVSDPRACVRRVSDAMHRTKRDTPGGDLLVAAADVLGPALLTGTLRLALRLRAFNTVVTNVPGAATAGSLLGARLTGLVPIVNLWPHEALGIAAASYAATMSFGLQADRRVVPDLAALRDDLAAAFDALHAASGASVPAASPA